MLTEERINSNYLAFIKRLETYGCYSEEMFADLGEKIRDAPYSRNDEFGGAYRGGMIEVVLYKLCKIGYSINENVFLSASNPAMVIGELAVNRNMLMRVLLLLNLSKADMFVDATEQWKVRKGIMYDFNRDIPTTMKLGMRTLYLCQKYGIRLEEEEYEAIGAVDVDDDNAERFRTPLYTLVKAANMFTSVLLRREWETRNGNVNNSTEM